MSECLSETLHVKTLNVDFQEYEQILGGLPRLRGIAIQMGRRSAYIVLTDYYETRRANMRNRDKL